MLVCIADCYDLLFRACGCVLGVGFYCSSVCCLLCGWRLFRVLNYCVCYLLVSWLGPVRATVWVFRVGLVGGVWVMWADVLVLLGLLFSGLFCGCLQVCCFG